MFECACVGLVNVSCFSQTSFTFCGLASVVEQVALVSMSTFNLAVLGYFKAFFCSGMCFELWHCSFLLILALRAGTQLAEPRQPLELQVLLWFWMPALQR